MDQLEKRTEVEAGPFYRVILGENGIYRTESLEKGIIIFESELSFYEAVVGGDEGRIRSTGGHLRSKNYTNGGAEELAIANWRRSINNFRSMPRGSIVLHWEKVVRRLYWGVVADEEPFELRRGPNRFGQYAIFLGRRIKRGWQETSLRGAPLRGLSFPAGVQAHSPSAIQRVVDPTYFRSLIIDRKGPGSSPNQAGYSEAARTPASSSLNSLEKIDGSQNVVGQIVDYFLSQHRAEMKLLKAADINRMAATAVATAAYANGQTVLRTIKIKDLELSARELVEEIYALWTLQDGRCALTDYKFHSTKPNKHLLPSLDRKDSAKGYVKGNLQIVTRAANFFKSASDELDWRRKSYAMMHMAKALKRRLVAEANAPRSGD